MNGPAAIVVSEKPSEIPCIVCYRQQDHYPRGGVVLPPCREGSETMPPLLRLTPGWLSGTEKEESGGESNDAW